MIANIIGSVLSLALSILYIILWNIGRKDETIDKWLVRYTLFMSVGEFILSVLYVMKVIMN